MLRKDFILCKTRNLLNEFMAMARPLSNNRLRNGHISLQTDIENVAKISLFHNPLIIQGLCHGLFRQIGR